MRWQPFAVGAALAAPPLVLALLVWPTSSAGARAAPFDAGEIAGELSPGDQLDGSVADEGVSIFEVTGTGGAVRIDVLGNGFDSTLTIIDPDSGGDLGVNDDTNGFDPALIVDLDDGQTVLAEVRGFGGIAGNFTITVESVDGDELAPQDAPVPPTGVFVPPPRGPGTVVPEEFQTTIPAPPETTIPPG